jgi:hypothetical protein
LSAWVWSIWGRDGFPVGTAWWDELALEGAAHAVQQGMVPAVDFWAPFILPIYLKALAQSLAGLSGGYVLECLMQGAVVLLLLTALLGLGRHSVWVYLLGAWAVLQVLLPFNFGSLVQAPPGAVSFAGAYNRLGGALVSLVILAMGLRQQCQQRGLVLPLALVLSMAFLTKVTAFQIGVAICAAHGVLCGNGASRWWWCRPVGLAVVLLSGYLTASGMGPGYLGALGDLAKLRWSLWHERLIIAEAMMSDHQVEILVLVMVAVLAAGRGALLRTSWLGPVSCYLLSSALLVIYMLSNFGDNGLFPVLTAVHVLLLAQPAERRQGVGERALALGGTLTRVANGLLMTGLLIYAGLGAHWVMGVYERSQSSQLIHFPVWAERLRHHHRVDAADWASRPALSVSMPAWPPKPSAFAAYVDGLDEALQHLDRHVPDRTRSVYALDFPSYAFAVLGGYRVPAHTYPWLLNGHEISRRVHPEASVLFADVDVLMVSTCSLSEGNRQHLFEIYRASLMNKWHRSARLRCWEVWERT